jgi:hypothetical protein
MFFDILFNIVGNSSQLIVVVGLTNDEKVGNGFRYFTKIKAYNLFAFFILNGINDGFENLAVSG